MTTSDRCTEAEEQVRRLGRRWAEAEGRGDAQALGPLLADDFILVGPLGSQTQRSTYQGRDASGRFRVTQVAVRQRGRWVIAGIHLSPVAQPQAPGEVGP